MGEIPERVFNVGCPSIDAILAVKDNQDIIKKFSLSEPYFLVIQHPVTSEINNSNDQINITLEAIEQTGINALVILPNNDAGYSPIVENIKNSKIQSVETLSIDEYVNLLKYSNGLIGNSSSGIHEAATFNIPVINIGTRQQGRLRPKNVIDTGHDVEEIIKAIHECKKIKNDGIVFDNPYGDGTSSVKIVDLLKTINIGNEIIQKRITY